jgi:uncharacterized RDD family membrane protein YckC
VDQPEEIRSAWTRASFVQRLGGFLVDRVLLSVAGAFLSPVFVGTVERPLSDDGWYFSPRQALFGLLLEVLYFTLTEGSASGQSLGKRLLRIRVVDFETGERIDYRRALGRSIGKILSGIPFALGYLWMLWDRDGQTWHDKLAHTTVANVQRMET